MMIPSLVNGARRSIIVCRTLKKRVFIYRSSTTVSHTSSPVKSPVLINEQQLKSKENTEHDKNKSFRNPSTLPNKDKHVQTNQKVKTSNSFVMNLFQGHFNPHEIFPYPNVITEEQKDNIKILVDPICKFLQEKNDPAKNDELEKIPDQVMNGLKEQGLFGIQVPVEYGGLGLTNTQAARLFEIIGAHDLSISMCIGEHQLRGFKGILLYGNDAQKQKYLSKLTTGEQIAALALVEPSADNDVSSIKTKAVLSPDDRYYILNGSKIWVSNGGIADVFTVFAQVQSIDDNTGLKQNRMTAFIVERAFGGLTHGLPEKKMGIKASNAALIYFEDCKVPVENVLGTVGNGYKIALDILNHGRFATIAGLSGAMKVAIQKSINFAKSRLQFGHTLDKYGNIQEKLVQMEIRQYVTESMAYLLAQNMDRGIAEYQCEASIGKIFASEAAWYVIDEAIQIHGGMGFMRSTGLERILRDLRVFRILEGTNDILRLSIAFAGLQDVGLHLSELQKAVRNFNLNIIFDESSKLLRRNIGKSDSPNVNEHVHPSLHSSGLLLSNAIDSFATVIERLLIKYGKSIRDERHIVYRFGNIAIDLYSMAVSLSRCTQSLNNRLPSADHESKLVQIWCEEAYDRVNNKINLLNSAFIERARLMNELAQEIVDKGSTVPVHPLGF